MNLNRSQREVLRLLLRDADRGMSFKQLRLSFPRGISQRGLADALKALEAGGVIERNTSLRAKGAHWNYRIVHPAPQEIIISDVVNFLKHEPTGRYYTGVLWMGILASSEKSLGLVLNEDKDYNREFLGLFLTVHDKWRRHVEKEYAESGRTKELRIIRKYETELLEVHRLYGGSTMSPFTKANVSIDTPLMLHYSILEQSQILRGMVTKDGGRRSYSDFILWWMSYVEKMGLVAEPVRAEAQPHKKYLSRRLNKRVYEAFLSRSVPPQSVLFTPFGFNSPLQRAAELMAQYVAVQTGRTGDHQHTNEQESPPAPIPQE
jgi:hypothetical protein